MDWKKRRWAVIPAALFLTASAFVGTTAAYLSKSPGEAENVLTIAEVTVGLTEENWDEETNSPLHPGEAVSKDPVVTNTGETDAWIFLQVDVPMAAVRLTDPETKKKTEKKKQELFSFKADEEQWELISRQEGEQNCRYIYGYRTILSPDGETDPLFEEIQAVSYLEGDLETEESYVLQINAQGIQTGTDGTGLAEIYEEFLRQSAADGKGENA